MFLTSMPRSFKNSPAH